MDKNLATAAAVLEGGAGAGAAAPAGAVADGGEVAAGAALGGGAGVAVAAAGAGAVTNGAAAGGGAARTAAEKEAIYKEIDALYEANEYVESCEYNTDDDIDEDNFEYYVQRQLKKFESQKLKTLHRGRHVCPFCPYKVKDGLLASLEMHAMDTRNGAREWQGKADHEALARFVLGPRLPHSGRIPKRRRNI
ncbi:hypothetical protein QYE76_019441 [Lolium multiflorum]|uniref:Uncharacterized protein n=1 Tax=Lolium multiflorum TaxID=4521 RepID=A0AAD8VP38_LOLMU|nr:hypothetical protein QYE76_019441 [Lolium multiflorum]